MAGKALETVRNALSKLRTMAPWKITGVASGAEFRHYLAKAPEYRVRAPGSQVVRAVVPQAETDRIYNIRYHTRDSRRAHMLVGGTHQTEIVAEKVDPKALQKLEGLPPLPGARHRWGKRQPYLYEETGYT